MENPLQEHPYLFANGKFRAKESQFGYTEKIMGVDISNNEIILEAGMHAKMRVCTLIARPISDITIPEAHKAIRMLPFDMSADEYRDLNGFVENTDQFLYLLSIGVYPLDQSHFETGIVIDSTTIK